MRPLSFSLSLFPTTTSPVPNHTTNPILFFWLPPGFYEPWLVYHSEHHQCKNWAKIREWAEEHSAGAHGHQLPLHPHEDRRTSDALNEPWFDPSNMTYIDGLCGNGYC